MNRSIITFFSALFLFACQSPQDKQEETTKNVAPPVQEARSAAGMQNDFNALEAVFDNQNYLIADKKDSSYFYFSRLNHSLVRTYAYQLVKGDSAKVQTFEMKPDSINNICWEWNGRKLKLTSATRGRIVWTDQQSDSLKYEFLQLDKNRIALTFPDGKKVVLQKILPLSLFLVRSRYDYQHGTNYAFDSTGIKKPA